MGLVSRVESFPDTDINVVHGINRCIGHAVKRLLASMG